MDSLHSFFSGSTYKTSDLEEMKSYMAHESRGIIDQLASKELELSKDDAARIKSDFSGRLSNRLNDLKTFSKDENEYNTKRKEMDRIQTLFNGLVDRQTLN